MNRKQVTTVIIAMSIVALFIVAIIPKLALPAGPEKYTINLDTIGVTFKLPKGYAALQSWNRDTYYVTTVSFGKEFRPGHLTWAPLTLTFTPALPGACFLNVTAATPHECVDALFADVTKKSSQGPTSSEFGTPKFVSLFGNKAVKFVGGGLYGIIDVVGYFTAEQQPKGVVERGGYLVKVETIRGVPHGGPEIYYPDLEDAVVDSLAMRK